MKRLSPAFLPITFALVLLASCTSREPLTVTEMTEKGLPQEVQIPPTFQEAANQAIEATSKGWLHSFHDPQLESLVREAIDNNLNIRAAAANVDAAAALATQAGAELKPVVVAAGSGTRYDGGGWKQLNSRSGVLSLSWEVDLWGRVRSQAQAGTAAFEAAQYQLEWLYQSIAALTAKTWFLLSEARQQFELAQEALALSERTLKLVQAMHRQGKVTNGDLALAKAGVAQAQASLRQAKIARQKASRGLELLLGRYPAAALQGVGSYHTDFEDIPAGLPSELLERRPDLLAAQRAIAAQFFSVETAKAARLPKISLTAGAGSSSNELSNLLSLGTNFWSVGANFLAPVYTGGALKAQVDIESAKFQAALANYGQLALTAFSEVEQGLASETLLREREHFLRQAVKESSESLRVASKQFEVGKVTLLAVLQQQGAVISAKAALINVQDLRLQQRVDLHLALGGSFAERE